MNYITDRDQEDESDNERREEIARIPVIEEKIKVDKKTVEKATVRIRKEVTEEDVKVKVPLIKEEFEVERIPVNKYIDSPPGIRHEGDTTIVPVVKEVLVKRLVLVEEVRLTKKRTEKPVNEQISLREEKVIIEREEYPGNTENRDNMY